MHPHQALIERFYTAFQQKDYLTMQQCYHPDVRFSDPVFPKLKGAEAGLMWQMLLSRSQDFQMTFSNVEANAQKGSCDWVATYTFTSTGRLVKNVVHAEFLFKDGLISRHDDYFSFYEWSSQALGFTGKLLGWSRYLEEKIQTKAAEGLQKFIQQTNP
ncbi:nuclear transport factor 2 family protein [Runella sp. MFBS21]|uniref:nuclear transport factor 2 family protein n=1 Tax=Runella sp. MFBS21 TaxID=3034018 RepID=UPI0023F68624|nr:nuclear transport factor 2 family protein [Runella sp. MFBS21]MDF7821150.1 nuclear transport factor 2 family protein [Runella sp. MFBS21]